jgi:bifunctional DNA-binding transcriptional regulator/antitoxin component of YhaV-PrlF toxin-antitoxin module
MVDMASSRMARASVPGAGDAGGAPARPVLAKITSSGQISVPADVRRRWGSERVVVLDRGDHLVVKPVPDDPIVAYRGRFPGRSGSVEDLRRSELLDDERIETAKAERVGLQPGSSRGRRGRT